MIKGWWERRKDEGFIRTLVALCLGQLVSLALALAGLASSLVANQGVDAPLTLSFFTYLALAVVYGSIMLCRRQKLLVPWYWYIFLGFVDVQGNYLANKAYEFAPLTSVTILGCCTILWVVVLTWVFLGTRYSICQYFGIAICLAGLASVLCSDAGVGGGGGSKPLLGDILIIAGTLFFAFSNVGEEFCVKKKDRVEVVAMLGLFGALVTAVEIAIMERESVEAIKWSVQLMLTFAGYALSSFMFYALLPFVLKVDWWYYLAFVLVVLGIVVYSLTEKSPSSVSSDPRSATNLGSEYHLLDEETSDVVNNIVVS